MLTGHAGSGATKDFTERFPEQKSAEFYRSAQGLEVSSIGLGSYLGDMDERTDRGYTQAVVAAVQGGINFIDTSLNYRNQRSELSIGEAIRQLTSDGTLKRTEFVVC